MRTSSSRTAGSGGLFGEVKYARPEEYRYEDVKGWNANSGGYGGGGSGYAYVNTGRRESAARA
jgi:hypothetical protein